MSIQEFMNTTTVPMSVKGYDCLKLALTICVEDPDMRMGDIVRQVAKLKNYSATSVDANLRRAINIAYANMQEEWKRLLFNNKERVKAADFVKSVAYAIKFKII